MTDDELAIRADRLLVQVQGVTTEHGRQLVVSELRQFMLAVLDEAATARSQEPTQAYRVFIRASQVANLHRMAMFLRQHALGSCRVAHIPGITKQGYAEFCKLKYWRLIAPGAEAHTWAITPDGYRFLFDKLAVPAWRWVFMDSVVSNGTTYVDGEVVPVWAIAPDVMSPEKAAAEAVDWQEFLGKPPQLDLFT